MGEHTRRKVPTKRIFKIIVLTLMALIIVPLVALFVVRGINTIRYNISNGVQERIFVTLGGIEQALHIRGEDISNPVIIWLHGGPGWSDAYELAPWQRMMERDFTFVRWSQRGSGSTYRRNPNAPISIDILIQDLDELVNYVTARFGQPVYIVGDSWGSLLGITYSTQHPENVAGFVGVSQVIDMHESLRIAFEMAYELATVAGNIRDAEQMRAVYERVGGRSLAVIDILDFVLYQGLPSNYLAVGGESQGAGIFFSPWFGFSQFRDLIGVATNNSLFLDRNRPLLCAMDTFAPPERLEIPVAFIMGSEDFITNTNLVAEYYQALEALSKNLFIIDGSGHAPYRSQPALFAELLREALTGFYN